MLDFTLKALLITLKIKNKSNDTMGKNEVSEVKSSWSSIEKYNDYYKAVWTFHENGIPSYRLLDKNCNVICIKTSFENN